MTNAEIDAIIRPHIEAAGLKLVNLIVRPYDDNLMLSVPVADVYVELPSAGASQVHAMMLKAGKSLSLQLGHNVRTGYYSAAIGYDDIPADQAMLEFDDLPFDLEEAPVVSP